MINQALIQQTFPDALFPEENFVVLVANAAGILLAAQIATLQQAGIAAVISLQSNEETIAPQKQALEQAGIAYYAVPIRDERDLKQILIMQFDKALREQYGKEIAILTEKSDYAGAVMALRAGWLRGRKVETAMATGKAYGLTTLADVVHKRILVPR